MIEKGGRTWQEKLEIGSQVFLRQRAESTPAWCAKSLHTCSATHRPDSPRSGRGEDLVALAWCARSLSSVGGALVRCGRVAARAHEDSCCVFASAAVIAAVPQGAFMARRLVGFSSDLGLVMRDAVHVQRAQLAFVAREHFGVHSRAAIKRPGRPRDLRERARSGQPVVSGSASVVSDGTIVCSAPTNSGSAALPAASL